MRVIVCGTRGADSVGAVWLELTRIFNGLMFDDPIVVVHGDCPDSADEHASQFVAHRPPSEFTEEKHPADWAKHGRAAGPIRNEEMAAAGAMLCIACWDGKSRGTLDMIIRAAKHGITVKILPCTVRKAG